MQKYWIIGLASAVVLVAALLRPWKTADATPRSPAELVELREQIAELEQRVRAGAAKTQQLAARSSVQAPAPLSAPLAQPPSSPAPPEPGSAPAQPPGGDPAAIETVVADCDARLATETPDVNWSRATISTIRDAIAGLDSTARLVSAECAATLCRTTVESESLESQRALARDVGQVPPFQAGTLYRYDRSGKYPRMTMYVAREGHRLDPE